MKITPSAGPTPTRGEYSGNSASSPADAARARAIAMIQGNAPQSQTQASPAPAEVVQAQANSNVPEQNQGQSTDIDESTPVPVAAIPAKTEEPISSQYAVLARKEKAFRAKVQAQEQQLQAERQALAAAKAEIEAQKTSYEKDYIPKQRLNEDTVQALLEAGISYDQITSQFLQQASNPTDPRVSAEIKALRAELAALKGETESTKKSIVDTQQANYNEALNTMKSDARRLVKEFPEEYQAIKETDSTQDVVDLIVKTYEEDKELMTVEEAAAMVEQELVERISKYAQLSKIQQKIKQGQPSPAPQNTVPQQTAPQGTRQQQPAKTLTNNLGGARQLTTRERAILAFEGKLGK